MKICILGGGLTGLTAAYHLARTGHTIQVIEKGERWGGLAGGFKYGNWEWELERTYHHIFSNDEAILDLARDIKYNAFGFSYPLTASLFGCKDNYRIFPVDSPKDFLLLPELSFISKIRAGVTLVFLKISPYMSWFEKISSFRFLQKTMGLEVWRVLWEQLFRKKYGKYAETILASFIWARIKKRTQKLGYPTGGFQHFIDTLTQEDRKRGVSLISSTSIEAAHKKNDRYEVQSTNEKGEVTTHDADLIISTLPYPVTCKVMRNILGQEYVKEQEKRKYLYAINLILRTKKPILENTYWLNVGAEDIPIMCIVQHTNFIDPKHYGGDAVCYIAWYVDKDSHLLNKNEKEMLDFVLPHLQNIAPHMDEVPEVVKLFKAPYAQPIFDAEFAAIPRAFSTPAKNVFVANMDMTYPYDRGTNYAVQLGKDVSNFVLTEI